MSVPARLAERFGNVLPESREQLQWRERVGEVVVEVPLDVTEEDIERLMTVSPKWAMGLPLGAEAKEMTHYAK